MDVTIPLRVSCLHRSGNGDPRERDKASRRYARCLQQTLDYVCQAGTVAGVWNCQCSDVGKGTWGEDESGGLGVVSAEVTFRTTET